MKKLKNIKVHIILASVMILFSSCDLDLQENYDFDESATIYPPIVPFNMTMWEFMTQQPDFTMMVEAVQLAGMESIYSGGEDNKTVLMLRNQAMQEFLNNQGAASVSAISVAKWEKFLKYHVITTRFEQNDLNSQEDVQFQTLIEGPNGRINIWMWRRYMEIQVNRNEILFLSMESDFYRDKNPKNIKIKNGAIYVDTDNLIEYLFSRSNLGNFKEKYIVFKRK